LSEERPPLRKPARTKGRTPAKGPGRKEKERLPVPMLLGERGLG